MRKRAKKKIAKKAQIWVDLQAHIEKHNMWAQTMCAAHGHMLNHHVFVYNDCVCTRCGKTF